MTKLKLPNEIVLMIGNNLDSQRDLYSLVQVNRQFYGLLNHLLYRYNMEHYDGCGIIWAAQRGYLGVLKGFVAAGFDVQYKSPEEYLRRGIYVMGRRPDAFDLNDPILHASKNGHLDVVKYLLTEGSDPCFENTDRETAILLASMNGHLPVVKVLHEAGGSFPILNGPGYQRTLEESPLWWAITYSNRQEVHEYFLSHLQNISYHASLCFPVVALRGHTDLVSLLLSYGADINFQCVGKCIETDTLLAKRPYWRLLGVVFLT